MQFQEAHVSLVPQAAPRVQQTLETVDAASTIRLLEAIEAMYPLLLMIHVFLDNARYHHAKIVQEWLAQPGRRVTLHFIPAYCHRVAGGGRPPPAPTERSVRISRTTLFGNWFTELQEPATSDRASTAVVAATESVLRVD